MKKLLLFASALAVTACSQANEADTQEVADEAPAEETATLAADGAATPGLYRITTSEGEIYMEDVKADGTYTTSNEAGELVETGQWRQPSPDQYCTIVDEAYRDEDDDGSEKCNSETIDAAGVWTSVNEDGETAIVERADS